MKRSGILAAGNFIVDHVKIIDTYPHQDGLASIKEEIKSNGGSPYNLLIDMAKLGASFPLAASGLIGMDAYGEFILKDCLQYQIDVSKLQQTAEANTSYTDVMSVAESGRRTFFHQRGANSLYNGGDLDFNELPYRIFHLGYLLLLDSLDKMEAGMSGAARLLQRAQEAGMETSVDLVSESGDRFKRIIPSSLPFVDYLFLNEYEASQITGIPIDSSHPSTREIHKAANVLLEMGVGKWVFIHMPAGVWACGKSGDFIFQASLDIPTSSIKGAAGAGDALAAGILLGIHENWPMDEILTLGVCNAASSLFDPTCSGHILPLNETLGLRKRFTFREPAL